MMRRVGRSQAKEYGDSSAFAGYQPDEHDVLICTYFKSGTNWAMQICQQIAWRGKAEYEHIHDVIPWPDAFSKKYAIDVKDPTPQRLSPTGKRVIKTHLNWENVPHSESARYITIMRDPKDVFVSSYHFFHALGLGVIIPNIATWLDVFLSSDFMVGGSWGKYVAEYWEQRNQPNLLILSYKTMKKDLPGTVDQLAKFMGVQLSPEEFAAVCEKSSFKYMKAIDKKFSPGIAPWGGGNGEIIRTGKQGGSSELLTLAQQKRVDAYFQAELKQLGSDFPYTEFCDLA
ncbi:MAG TPA: sulfotransferase domain-containing protein, partial [Phototrophicaceae bacterium]|nr:sulfotransferase domain-containing protein [Phototrophicaceae bacterium]